MKILFVYRGIGQETRNSVVDAQAESLKEMDLELYLYPLRTGGIKGYYNSYRKLKDFLYENSFDIVHGHYSFSSIVAALAFKGKTIASLMGSDVYTKNLLHLLIIKFFARFVWVCTIVKSKRMKQRIRNSIIIPNGVNFNTFKPVEKKTAQKKVMFDHRKKNIIFVAEDIHSKVKNYKLAEDAVKFLKKSNIYNVNLFAVSGCNQQDLVYYYNAADLLLLTSLSEGSPNVVKEAMACNCPIIATDVGDVGEIINKTEGCYITSFDPKKVAEKIKRALDFGRRTNGRDHIKHLDIRLIARQIINIYKKVIDESD